MVRNILFEIINHTDKKNSNHHFMNAPSDNGEGSSRENTRGGY